MAVQGRITRSVDRSAWIPKFEGQARAGGSGGFSVLTNGSLTVNILGDGCCMSNVSPPFSKTRNITRLMLTNLTNNHLRKMHSPWPPYQPTVARIACRYAQAYERSVFFSKKKYY